MALLSEAEQVLQNCCDKLSKCYSTVVMNILPQSGHWSVSLCAQCHH